MIPNHPDATTNRTIETLESRIAPAFTATVAGTILTLIGAAGSNTSPSTTQIPTASWT